MTHPPDEEPVTIRQISSRIVYQNQWMTLREDQIQRPDGSRGIYSVVDKPDFALIIPTENDGFHLVDQYRYPTGGRHWEFPQGTYPNHEDGDPVGLARAELAEETGLHAGSLVHLGHLFTSHGTSGQGFHVFLAADLEHGIPHREIEEQDMRNQWFSRYQFEQMIRDGRIKDDSTLAAYTLLLLHDRKLDD